MALAPAPGAISGPRFGRGRGCLPIERRGRNARDVFRALYGDEPLAALLETPAPHRGVSVCAGPPRAGRLWLPGRAELSGSLARLRGVVGFLGYRTLESFDTVRLRENDPLPFPAALWYEPRSLALLADEQTIELLADDEAELIWMKHRLEAEVVAAGQPGFPRTRGPRPRRALSFVTTEREFAAGVAAIREHIREGDVYQVNLSTRFELAAGCDPFALYEALCRVNPSPYASYFATPWGAIVSASPELLIESRGIHLRTKPIAGTRPRGADAPSDRLLERALLTNEKEAAEHLMLVDLERNDLGRIARTGSVAVPSLAVVERYSHVMHLVSEVTALRRDGVGNDELAAAVFPGGTITGCPKRRAIELIDALEPVARNLFYGSCGWIDDGGDLTLNILIRTLLCTEDRVVGQAGAGIVADSDPAREWRESLAKAQALLHSLEIL